jgi:hypothetical protein
MESPVITLPPTRHGGSKRKVNKSLKAWVAFVKRVQKEEKLSYKDAIHRAKQRKDKGEKWMKGGITDNEVITPINTTTDTNATVANTTVANATVANENKNEPIPITATGGRKSRAKSRSKGRRRTRSKGRGRTRSKGRN